MDRSSKRRGAVTRKELLKSGAAAGASLVVAQGAGTPRALGAPARRRRRRNVAGMNVIVFLTDQERAIQHFPKDWARENLPGLRRLQRHGLTFNNAFTNACMCSPARSTWMTGYFPAQHGVKYTLEQDMSPQNGNPQVEMPLDLKNIATVMAAAGYNVVYKGKWHVSKPQNGEFFVPSDAGQYGFERWNPPDAGANQDPRECGGGFADHDGRYMDQEGDAAAGNEGVIEYLSTEAAEQQPFFMVVSLVNPHDVLQYPSSLLKAGYDKSWLDGDIHLPATVNEDLSTKPSVQNQFLRLFNATGQLTDRQMKRDYVNFYGNLMRSSDASLVQLLDRLDELGLREDTLIIRTADHGEMGLAHGGLRQKNFNFYEESIRVPLVYSNPRLYGRRRSSNALVSHVDFLPTLATLFGAPDSARADWEGVDYSRVVLDPSAKPPQRYIVFTYDDYQSGQPDPPYPQPPNHVVSIRERRWKLAKYYDVDGNERPQWEMYDLKHDPPEKRNIAYRGHRRTAKQQQEFRRLKRKLRRVQRKRLQPL